MKWCCFDSNTRLQDPAVIDAIQQSCREVARRRRARDRFRGEIQRHEGGYRTYREIEVQFADCSLDLRRRSRSRRRSGCCGRRSLHLGRYQPYVRDAVVLRYNGFHAGGGLDIKPRRDGRRGPDSANNEYRAKK